MTNPKNLNKCCPTNDGNVGKAIHSLSSRIKYLERANSDIENSLDEEKSRAIDVENTLQQHIEEEQNRASTKEEEILLGLNEEQTRAEDAELALSNKIDEDIETERSRAIDVETTISSNLTDEIAARKQAIINVINSIPDAQILPDWNLSDSNAKDFIKNKPHALDGKSAYELAVDNGFEGTEQEWLASLKGPQGILGETGPQGVQGILGEQGVQGVQGPKGDTGDAFDIYAEYASVSLMNADTANVPVGKFVIINSSVSDPDNSKLYIRTNNTTDYPTGFKFLTDMSGAQGIQGPQGELGIQGVLGIQGIPGNDGHSPVVTASKSGSTTTIYVDGTSIATIEDGLDGQDGLNGTNGTNGTNGSDGITPHIDSTTGNWFIGVTDTGIHAQGPAGLDGSNATINTDDFLQNPNVCNGHEYVEINGKKWATKNLGATTITDPGFYFQWGDTQGYAASQIGNGEGLKPFSIADYKYGDSTGESSSLVTKYNSTDGKTILDASDEAVIAAWGNGWRMPTISELYSLYYANKTWVNNYNNSGINGYLFTDDNDSSKCMFLPAAGSAFVGSTTNVNERCAYWSSELSNSYESCAKCISLSSSATQSEFYMDTLTRHYGHSIRPIFDENASIIPNKTASISVTGSYNDLTDKPTIPTVPSNETAASGGTTLSVVTTGEKYTWNNKANVWRGTQAQYDLLTPDSNTIYIITSAS